MVMNETTVLIYDNGVNEEWQIEFQKTFNKAQKEWSEAQKDPKVIAKKQLDDMRQWMCLSHKILARDIAEENNKVSYEEDEGYSYYNYADYGDTFVMDGDDIVGDR